MEYLHFICNIYFNHCNGVVVTVFALQAVDLGFIPFAESYQKTIKNVIHNFPT